MTIACTATDTMPRVVGVGSCGIDYLAAVAAFPQPDEKLRTQQLEVYWWGYHMYTVLICTGQGLLHACVVQHVATSLS